MNQTVLRSLAGRTPYSLQGYARTVVFPWYRRGGWKQSTATTSTDRIEHHILKELGNQPLASFNRTILQDFLDKKARTKSERHEELLSASTVTHLRWDLRQIFRMAVNDGLIARNPAELLHAPKRTRAERRVLTIDELRSILGTLPVREKLIISLAGIAGLRPGEILAIRWGDIREDGVHIERAIYRGIIQTPKTHHSVRTAAISNSIREDIDAWSELSRKTNTDDWMFPNEKGHKPMSTGNYWRYFIKKPLDDLNIQGVTFQALRRTAVTLMNANGADPSVVAAQCGHTVDVSTNVYNKVGIERQADAINKLDSALASQSVPITS